MVKIKIQKIKYYTILFTMLIFLSACNSPLESRDKNNTHDLYSILKDWDGGELNSTEIEGLVFMREDEKLARDVYIILYKTWSQQVFNNISQSEQKHTDAIKIILDKYEISNPVTTNEVGIFQNEDLQNLYTTLVVEGNESLIAALEVGAAIEEIDIIDLEKNLESTDNEDITFMYNNLMRGSKNHLRAYVRNLQAQGTEYKPQYMEQESYLAIISSEFERGNSKGKRKGRK